jgi:hypothetical protein
MRQCGFDKPGILRMIDYARVPHRVRSSLVHYRQSYGFASPQSLVSVIRCAGMQAIYVLSPPNGIAFVTTDYQHLFPTRILMLGGDK